MTEHAAAPGMRCSCWAATSCRHSCCSLVLQFMPQYLLIQAGRYSAGLQSLPLCCFSSDLHAAVHGLLTCPTHQPLQSRSAVADHQVLCRPSGILMGASGTGDACWWSGPGTFGESNTRWLDIAPMQAPHAASLGTDH